MATVQELERALLAADAAGDVKAAEALARDLQRMTQITTEKPAEVIDTNSPGYQVGAEIPRGQRAFMAAMQGPAFNFADELAGVVGGLRGKVLGQDYDSNYEISRDIYRGATGSFQKENPILNAALQAGGGLLTMKPVIGISSGVSRMGITNPIANAAATGVPIGAVQGAGAATDSTANQAMAGAVYGGIGGAAGQGVFSGAKAGIQQVGARVMPNSAQNIAFRRIAEAFLRDEQNPGHLLFRLQNRFPQGRIVDAGGENVMNLADVTANLPGKTMNIAKNVIRERQATRADRMTDAAIDAMGTQGARLRQTISALTAEQERNAAPLYDIVRQTQINVDDELASLLSRARFAAAEAKKTAAIRGEDFDMSPVDSIFNGMAMQRTGRIPLSQLDQLKRSLYDAEIAAKVEGKGNDLSLAITGLRRQLIDKLDNMTTDQSGRSFYKQARDAFAGPAELKDAAVLGREFWNKPADQIREELADFGQSQLQAMRIGAMEALREKLGTAAGQAQVLNMWKDRATAEKMRAIFPSDSAFRSFLRSSLVEGKMKQLEGIRGGSKTFQRQSGADDMALSTATDLAQGAAGAIGGTVAGWAGLLNAAKGAWARISTPPQVRDEIGRILFARNNDPLTPAQVGRIRDLMIQIEKKSPSGAVGGTIVSAF